MRKFLKTNILEVFKTIYEAHGFIRDYVDKKEYENAQTLLADCQNTAIELGNLIEESEGEGFITISFLEEYCEALYETAISLSDEKNGHKVQKQLDKKIIKAENSVKNDIKVKLEVVFMPYKASMWDSLESIWKAADEDPDCNAYVVPIPYYDRKPGGAFDKFHYEGGEYPEYVPIVHYDAYKLEEHRPDIIYIHNPYDGNNYVTSVDPRFYSNELKKYTEKLVYVPYFVLNEPDPKNKDAVENVSHFIITPGVINADKVIVQSEAMRQVYIKVLLNRFSDTPDNRKNVEEKISGIGSPKFDKIINSDRDSLEIPEDWKKIIFRPDGSRKKVILYNVSVSTLLQYSEKMIKKINYVLDIFYENKDNTALLWRPHPLIKATIEAMRPQLWADYERIVNKYIKDGWGIYDDTSDLNRTIALSDGYYGDQSSVAGIFGCSGKPVMIQNPNCNSDFDESVYRKVRFSDANFDGKNLWFFSSIFNAVCTYDIENNQCKTVTRIPYHSAHAYEMYSAVKYISDKCIIFVPDRSYMILIYNAVSDKFDYVPLKTEGMNTAKYGHKFCDAVNIGDKLYFIPFNYKCIVSYNIKSKTVEYGSCLTDALAKYDISIPHGTPIFEPDSFCVSDNKIMLALKNTDIIVSYCTKSGNIEVNKVGSGKHKLLTIFHDDSSLDSFWLINSNKPTVINWNISTSEKEEYILSEKPETEYIKAIKHGDFIYIYDKTYNCVTKFNPKTKLSEHINLNNDGDNLNDYIGIGAGNCFMHSFNDKLMIKPLGSRLSIINQNDEITSLELNFQDKADFYCTSESLNLSHDDINKYNVQICYSETLYCSLPIYLDFISSKSNDDIQDRARIYRKSFANSDGTRGEKIHLDVKQS